MKAIYKAPNAAPEIINIDNTLEALQGAVGGRIETITVASDACIVCNEESRIKGMPFNCRLCGADFAGPLLIVGVKGDEFTDIFCPELTAQLFFGKEKNHVAN